MGSSRHTHTHTQTYAQPATVSASVCVCVRDDICFAQDADKIKIMRKGKKEISTLGRQKVFFVLFAVPLYTVLCLCQCVCVCVSVFEWDFVNI